MGLVKFLGHEVIKRKLCGYLPGNCQSHFTARTSDTSTGIYLDGYGSIKI